MILCEVRAGNKINQMFNFVQMKKLNVGLSSFYGQKNPQAWLEAWGNLWRR